MVKDMQAVKIVIVLFTVETCSFVIVPQQPFSCFCFRRSKLHVQNIQDGNLKLLFRSRPWPRQSNILQHFADSTTPPKYEGTIYAQSTPAGIGGVAVIRVSGPDAPNALVALCRTGKCLPKPRYASLRTLEDPQSHEILDKALVIFFPAPKSFTGEDVVEFHVHGGYAVVASVLDALCKVPGLRLAERGEFAKRAFLNGRIDLLEAEAINDLIHAESSGQQRQALNQISGIHRALYMKWRNDILRYCAHINAYIDYGESDGLEECDVIAPVRQQAMKTLKEIRNHLADGRRGECIRHGLQCTLVGPPNAGKSSLLNVLAARPAAIVSSIPGTTRDIVQVRIQMGGFPLNIDDTAGLRAISVDEIEVEGMKRSAASFRKADIRIIVLDGSTLNGTEIDSFAELLNSIDDGEDIAVLEAGKMSTGNWHWNRDGVDSFQPEISTNDRNPVVLVLNKIDMLKSVPKDEQSKNIDVARLKARLRDLMHCDDISVFWLSCVTREGIEELMHEIETLVKRRVDTGDNAPLITRARHRELLGKCVDSLQRFLDSQMPVDAQAEDLRMAVDYIGKIYGGTDVEDMLEVVFRDFCIGK